MAVETLTRLQVRLGYTFARPDLLRQALTHKSFVNENPGVGSGHNERLEFLGDAVLDFVMSKMLMEQYPEATEGDLSKIRASLVSEGSLASLAKELELGGALMMGRGEELSGGRMKNSILSDALEALFAAVYLDGANSAALNEIDRVIRTLFISRVREASTTVQSFDYKTALQEYIQKRYKETVQYRILSEAGPDHDKHFEAAVFMKSQECGRGKGRTKKQAEQVAAQQALERMREGLTPAARNAV